MTNELVERISELIFEKKGFDVKLVEVKAVSLLADYFVICSADSDTQVNAIAENVEKGLKEDGLPVWHKEGYRTNNWVLLDYSDVVVHIFKKDIREFYNLEKLWADAPTKDLVDTIDVPKKAKRTTKKQSL